MIDHLVDAHNSARAQYGKIAERFKNLDSVRLELQSLRDLGDFVDQDDVVRSASKLVGKGLTPAGLAGLLAGMPKDGEALSGWVGHLWQYMLQREQQMMPLMQQAKLNMGVKALQLLAGKHVMDRVGELQQASANQMAQPQGQEPPQGGQEAPPADASADVGGDGNDQ